MDIKEIILKEEIEFPKFFTNFDEKEYGIIFHNVDNKESHDSNHAALYPNKIMNLGVVLDEIRDFYKRKEIIPAIYHPQVFDYFEDNRDIFNEHGYEIHIEEILQVMVLSQKNDILTSKNLDIRRVLTWDERIAADILIPDDQEYEIDVIKNSLKNDYNYLFVGYRNGAAVTYVTLHKSKNGCTPFDYIVTAKEHRHNGYAREILSHAVDFCNENKLPICYQWPAHKTSERICYEAGFRTLFKLPAGYASYIGV